MKRRVVLCALMSLLLLSGCGAGQGSAFSLNASIVGQVDTLDPAMAVGQANETLVLHQHVRCSACSLRRSACRF